MLPCQGCWFSSFHGTAKRQQNAPAAQKSSHRPGKRPVRSRQRSNSPEQLPKHNRLQRTCGNRAVCASHAILLFVLPQGIACRWDSFLKLQNHKHECSLCIFSQFMFICARPDSFLRSFPDIFLRLQMQKQAPCDFHGHRAPVVFCLSHQTVLFTTPVQTGCCRARHRSRPCPAAHRECRSRECRRPSSRECSPRFGRWRGGAQ